jgi:16S rRNA (cytosine967-C5)-methyltransferase
VRGQKPREIAIEILGKTGESFVEILLGKAPGLPLLSLPDRHLCQELVYGIIRWQGTLDWLIARKAPRRPAALVENLLRLGLYQIFWLDRIPNHAAVHETVELAKNKGAAAQAGFINAVLRGYLREFAVTKQLLEDLKTRQPHIGYSHPDWLAARWAERWGAKSAADLMAWNNTPPRTFARVNTLKTDAASLERRWGQEGVEFEPFHRDWLANASVFELKSHPPLDRLPSFLEGQFYVQDPSTLLAVHELDPQPGETVLDFCAAPGGKLTLIGQKMRNEGRLLAHDTSAERRKLIAENCARLGVHYAEVTGAGLLPAESYSPSYSPILCDRILLDAPCSNTGVLRRRVDLRWRIRRDEITRLQTSQRGLLRQAVPLLKQGGTIVYSTCSLEPEENSANVNEFLRENPDFELKHSRELLPFVDGVDGAYVACLARSG